MDTATATGTQSGDVGDPRSASGVGQGPDERSPAIDHVDGKILHHDGELALLGHDVERGDDVRTPDARSQARLVEEHRRELRVLRELRVQALDRHRAREARWPEQAAKVQRGHPAGGDLPIERIAPHAADTADRADGLRFGLHPGDPTAPSWAAPGAACGMAEKMPEPPSAGSTRVRGPRIVVRYEKARIEVVRGPDAGKSLEVAGQSVKVGTGDDYLMVLHVDSVSRAHCEARSPSRAGCACATWVRPTGVFADGALSSTTPSRRRTRRLRLGDTELAQSALAETVEREQTTRDRFGDLLGASPRMRELFADLERLATADVTLLIEGETGTGKEIVAESVHRASARAGPFVVFDCGAVTPTLVESELFGHERGAFTGATQAHAGVCEQADGGTLFLDEIGELPKELQPKLLRAIEKRQIRRVGGTKVIAFDTRVVAATNRQLRAEVAHDRFREDLYFRLAAAHVTVPALRERMGDLPLLVEHFLSLERPPRSARDLSGELWDLLRAHRWPGNVRELRNAVQRFLVTPDRALRDLAGTGPAVAAGGAPAATPLLPLRVARRENSDAFERDYLALALGVAGGNVTQAAALAEVSRQNLQKLLKKHGRE